MKKNILLSLILALTISMVGCGDNERVTSDGNDNITQEEYIGNEKDNDYYYDIFMEYLPEVREYYETLGVTLEMEKSKHCNDGYEFTVLEGRGDGNSEIYSVSSGIAFSSEGEARSNFHEIRFNIDENKLKAEGFRFKDSVFNPLSKIIFGENYDCTKVDKIINDYYQNDGDSLIEVKNGNTVERISCDSEEILYLIRLN